MYYNYKGFHSIVLMAVVDSNYKFIWVAIGAHASASFAQIVKDSIGFPRDEPLLSDDALLPFFLVGDDAFALRTWMMKPFSHRNIEYEERIFNYRLGRARMVVDNAFGILSNRFRCLLTTLPQGPMVVQRIVMAAVVLHNIMRTRYPTEQMKLLDHEDSYHQFCPGAWRDDNPMLDLQHITSKRICRSAKKQRLYLKQYYNNEDGAVEWQDRMI